MHPIIRTLGKALRLVGISSPEDAAKPKPEAEVPDWRRPDPPPPAQAQDEPR